LVRSRPPDLAPIPRTTAVASDGAAQTAIGGESPNSRSLTGPDADYINVITSTEPESVSFTDLSRRTGHYLSQAMARGSLLIRDRHENVVLEIRRVEPKGEVTV
jgi:hypothetical protein